MAPHPTAQMASVFEKQGTKGLYVQNWNIQKASGGKRRDATHLFKPETLEASVILPVRCQASHTQTLVLSLPLCPTASLTQPLCPFSTTSRLPLAPLDDSNGLLPASHPTPVLQASFYTAARSFSPC